jgi:hypothetical protein
LTGASALCYNSTMLQSTTTIFRDIHIVWSPSMQHYAFSYQGHCDVVAPAGTSELSRMEMLRYVMDNYTEVFESAKELFIRSEILGNRYRETGSL